MQGLVPMHREDMVKVSTPKVSRYESRIQGSEARNGQTCQETR